MTHAYYLMMLRGNHFTIDALGELEEKDAPPQLVNSGRPLPIYVSETGVRGLLTNCIKDALRETNLPIIWRINERGITAAV